MLPIRDMILTNHNRPKKKLLAIKGVVVHWTANEGKGSDADNNRDYFQTTTRSASAHYVVDDHQIVRCVPDDEVAYHVGAKTYTKIGMTLTKGTIQADSIPFYSPNFHTIGIEMCVNSDGIWAKTYQNTLELVAYLLKKYKLTTKDLYRHYDITGKICPAMMIEKAKWDKFIADVEAVLNPKPIVPSKPVTPPVKTGIVTATKLNVRIAGNDTAAISKVKPYLLKNEKVTILQEKNGWYRIGIDMWVSAKFIKL